MRDDVAIDSPHAVGAWWSELTGQLANGHRVAP
jgi:hypothetical protein